MHGVQQGAWLDQEDKRTAAAIRKYGWLIEYVGGGCCDVPGCDGGKLAGPPFAYTVGLFGLGHPELLVIGASMNMAYGVINDLGGRIRDGQDLVPGQLLSSRSGHTASSWKSFPIPGRSCSPQTATTNVPTRRQCRPIS